MTIAPELKSQIVGRLRQFPVMNRSMLGVSMVPHRSEELTEAVNELVEEGVVKKGQYSAHRKMTPFYYLASEEANLLPYVQVQK